MSANPAPGEMTLPSVRSDDRADVVVQFHAPARRRGRPRKPPLVSAPCTIPFDTVCAALVGWATRPDIWFDAVRSVRNAVAQDRSLDPVAPLVMSFLLDHVNRSCGRDWHSRIAIAAALGRSDAAVKRALSQLVATGRIQRRVRPDSGRCWETTVPVLMHACETAAHNHGSENPTTRVKKMRCAGQKNPSRGTFFDPQNGESTDSESHAGCDRRHDRGLPIGQRVRIWRYGAPSDPVDRQLYDEQRAAARGWDVGTQLAAFAVWIDASPDRSPGDAHAAFVAWMRRTITRPAPGYYDSKTAGRAP